MKKLYFSLLLVTISSVQAMDDQMDGEGAPKSSATTRHRRRSSPAALQIPPVFKESEPRAVPSRPPLRQRKSISVLPGSTLEGMFSQSLPAPSAASSPPAAAACGLATSPPDGSLTARIKNPKVLEQIKQEVNDDEFDLLAATILDQKIVETQSNPQQEFEERLKATQNIELVMAYYRMKENQAQSNEEIVALYRALYKKVCEVSGSATAPQRLGVGEKGVGKITDLISADSARTRQLLEQLRQELAAVKKDSTAHKDAIKTDLRQLQDGTAKILNVLNLIVDRMPTARAASDGKRSLLRGKSNKDS